MLITDKKPAEGGEQVEFVCDEEPHVLRPEQGFGFNPLMLGDRLKGSEPLNRTYEVVRKLGYGGSGSMWLVRFSK